MRIVCDSCGTKYSISDDKVRGKVFKIRCKSCSHVIIVRGDGEDGAGSVDAGGGGADAVWFIVRNGQQDGPFTPQDIGGFIALGEVTPETYAWREGFADWLPLSAAEGLSHLVKAAPAESALMQATDAISVDGFDDGGATRVVSNFTFNPPPAEPAPVPRAAAAPAPVRAPDPAPYSAPDPAPIASLSGGVALGGGGFGGAAVAGFGGGMMELGDSPSFAEDPVPSISGMGSLAPASLDSALSKEPVPTSAKPSNGVSRRNGHMVASRNEDSVLFSLNSLASTTSNESEEPKNTEASGLIDIMSLQSSSVAVASGRGAAGHSSPAADPFGAGVAGPAIAVPAMIPMGTRKSNLPLFLGIGGGVFVILLLVGTIAALLIFRDTDPKVVEVPAENPILAANTPQKGAEEPGEAKPEAGEAKPEAGEAEGADKGEEDKDEAVADKGEEADKAAEGDNKEAVADNKLDKNAAEAKVPAVPKTAEEIRKEREEREKRLAELAAKERENKDKEPPVKEDVKTPPKGGGGDAIDDIISGIGGKKPPKGDDPVVKEDKTPPPTGAKKALEKSEVQRVIRGAYGSVNSCNSSQAEQQTGTVTVKFTIQPNGSVGGAQVTGAFAGSPVGGCIARVVRGLNFPAFDGSPLTITFPFVLR